MTDQSPIDTPDLNRIVEDPEILVGKPTVRGTRIPVSLILNLVAHGYSLDQVIEDYPILTREDVRAAIYYASLRMDRQEIRSLAPSR